jgi:hypothetical protein
MGYMAREPEKRADPRLLLPSARSVVCVALNYYQGEGTDPSWEPVARYARGRDYHDVMKGMLKHLAQFVVVDPTDERVQSRLFDEQERRHSDDPAGECHPSSAGKETARDRDERRRFRRPVDVVATGGDVASDHQGDGPCREHHREWQCHAEDRRHGERVSRRSGDRRSSRRGQ